MFCFTLIQGLGNVNEQCFPPRCNKTRNWTAPIDKQRNAKWEKAIIFITVSDHNRNTNINLINCRDLVSADNKGLTTHLHDRVFIAGIYLYSVPLCLICFASHEKLSRYSVLRKSIWAAIYLYFLCYRMVFLSMQV